MYWTYLEATFKCQGTKNLFDSWFLTIDEFSGIAALCYTATVLKPSLNEEQNFDQIKMFLLIAQEISRHECVLS